MNFSEEPGTPSPFQCDSKGLILVKSQRNILKALELLGVKVKYDEFQDRSLIEGLDDFDLLDDTAVQRLWLLVDEKFKFLPTFDFFFAVVMDAARQNKFHPVKDYLNGLKWDGVKRIDEWLIKYGKAQDTPFVRAVGALMLIAAVRRVKQPGCKFDEMPIIESAQGTNKSMMLAIMAVKDEWFTDDLPLGVDSKTVIERIHGKWLAEASELKGMRGAREEHLKSFLSRQIDRARLAWRRVRTELKRQCIVVGTTNHAKYLRDLTGNRRYWPVSVKEFDLEALKRDRDMLWAEAAAREAAGESIRLDSTLWDTAAVEQKERTIDEPWIDQIAIVLGDMTGKILNADAWTVVGLEAGRQTQDHNERLGTAMRHLGFERRKRRIEGEPENCYIRGEGELKRICVIRYSPHEVYAYYEGTKAPGRIM
jgi:predicted P-loop ATPase